jgi:hypothetical protein
MVKVVGELVSGGDQRGGWSETPLLPWRPERGGGASFIADNVYKYGVVLTVSAIPPP